MRPRWIEHRTPAGIDSHPAGDELFDLCRQGRLLRQGNSRRTYLCASPEGRALIVKHWFLRPVKHSIKSIFCSSAARHEWDRTLLARSRGLTEVEPLFLAERRELGMAREAYLIFSALPSRLTLCEALGSKSLSSVERQWAVRAFAEALAQNHARNICHGDFKVDNVIVDMDGRDGPRLTVIDWGMAYDVDPQDRDGRLREILKPLLSLTGLQVSREELSLFIEAYAEKTPWFNNNRTRYEEDLRLWARRQIRASAQRVMRNCTRRARRFEVGRHGCSRYYLFRGESASEALAAVDGDSSVYEVEESQALEVWRAVNVLLSFGHARNGIAGLVIKRKLMGGSRSFLVYNPDRKTLPFEALVESVKQILQAECCEEKM